MKRLLHLAAACCDAAVITSIGCVLLVMAALEPAEPVDLTTDDDEPVGDPDAWCSSCRVHRVRQDTYTGFPSYVPLCPVCSDRPSA